MSSDDHINRENGYNPTTKIYHSLRPNIPIPPITTPLSITQHVLSLLSLSLSSPSTTTFIVDSATHRRLSYSDLLIQIDNLSHNLRVRFPNLRKGDVAFILSPSLISIPVLYLALLANGVVISPANPISSESEITHQVKLSEPVIVFANSDLVSKIPKLKLGSVLLDSPEFESMITTKSTKSPSDSEIVVNQTDSAAILYSSGTTGRVKGVLISHRNLIALISGYYHLQSEPVDPTAVPVSLFSLPLFHVFGFFMIVRAVAIGDTLVLMERFDFEKMLKAVEEYRVMYMPVSPPLIVALTKSDLVEKYDLSSLQMLGCGGAALSKEATERFIAKFPHVRIGQGYGMTETCGGITRTIGPEEGNRLGSAGRIAEYMEAKIVDPSTGEALPPGERGELWLRGPAIMQGYVGDDAATAATLDSEGWLKTGDLCYFDSEGYLYIVDRLKELIKYKAYQVPPAELEHLLHSNPEIIDAAVIPFPDEDAGEIPMAFVVRRPGSSINEVQVMDFIAKQVAPYKKIRRVSFINMIPKSPAGKILRRELVNQALGVTAKL